MAYYLLEVIGTNAILATLLAGCVFAISKCWHRPALLHCLWIVVLAKLLMPASLNVPLVAIRTEKEEPAQAREVSATALMSLIAAQQAGTLQMNVPQAPHWWQSTVNVAVVTWITGAAACAAWIGWQAITFGRLLHRARPAPLRLQNQAESIAFELGLRRCPQVCIVRASISPLLWSLGRARIVLPASLLRELERDEINGVLAHELMHLKRRDHWLRWLEIAAVAAYWWLPVAWWARRQLRAAEELCCDLAVLERWPARAKDYARTLLKSNDWLTSRLPVPQTASGFGSAPFLKRRITMILSKNLTRRLSWPARIAVVLGAAAVLPLSPMSLHGDDDPGSKVVTIEIKKDGTVTVSVGPKAKKPAEGELSVVAKGLQYIARVQPDGGVKIEQADKEQHRPLTLKLADNSNAELSGSLTLFLDAAKVAGSAEKPKEGEQENPKDGETQKSATQSTAQALLLLAGQQGQGQPKHEVSVEFTSDQQNEGQPKPEVSVELKNDQQAPGQEKREVSVEFTNDPPADKQSAKEANWQNVVVKDAKVYLSDADGQVHLFNSLAPYITTQAAASSAEKANANAQLEFVKTLRPSITIQAAASNLDRIRQKEAELQQLSAQLKALQAELESLRAREKQPEKGPETEKPAAK